MAVSPSPDRTLPPAILLMGPTASGKTALALELARRLPIEIVSVDSALVFRDMDVGTAKPDAITRAAVPHHLVDIRSPHERYSAAQFATDAAQCMTEITARQRIPLLVGGTMLYFKALTEGLSELPPADAALRAALDERARARGWPALHGELARVDPVTAARLEPGDAQRIQRALEIHRLTGRPMSELLQRRSGPPPYRMLAMALEPADRSVLHERIARRLHDMLRDGLVEEVIALRRRYTLDASMPSMRAVGYRQVWQFLDGELRHDELPDKAIAATRQLAKRQLTWLRAMRDVTRLDCLSADLAGITAAWLDRML